MARKTGHCLCDVGPGGHPSAVSANVVGANKPGTLVTKLIKHGYHGSTCPHRWLD
jgi:hypothetical protein